MDPIAQAHFQASSQVIRRTNAVTPAYRALLESHAATTPGVRPSLLPAQKVSQYAVPWPDDAGRD